MRLCAACETSREWVGAAPTAKEVVLRNQGMICGGCGRFTTGHPLFRICEACATREGRCQHCMAYLTPEAEAKAVADETREALIDLFTLTVKTYGRGHALALFRAHADFAEQASLLERLDFRDLDYGREKRPIWAKVLGPNIYRVRFCEACIPVRPAPALIRAARCGHWTTARSPTWCPVCATEQAACESCGAPHA